MAIKIKDVILLAKFVEFAENEDWVGIHEKERTITSKDIRRAWEVLNALAKEEEGHQAPSRELWKKY